MAFSDQSQKYGVSFVALLAGFGASQFLGLQLWFAAGLSLASGWAIARFVPRIATELRVALALVCGQTLWIILGAIVIPAMIPAVAFDVVIAFALLGWVFFRPSRAAVIALIVFQLLALAFNIYVLSLTDYLTQQWQALIVHILIRIGVIAFSGVALHKGMVARSSDDENMENVFS